MFLLNNEIMNAQPLYIVADDLTGAADCAARCFGNGYSANIFIAPYIDSGPVDVYSFTTDSRSLPPFEAGKRTRQILRNIHSPNVLWYKKIDSTFRGNIGSESDAFIDELGFEIALVCPSFPLQNRGLSNGVLLLNHQKKGTSHLPTIFAAQSKYPNCHISLNMLEGSLPVLVQHMRNKHNQGTVIFTFDAITERHLVTIVDAYHELPYNTLLSGSAGLVGVLMSGDANESTAASQIGDISAASERVLIIVGSGSDTSHRQIRYLRAQPYVKIISTEDSLEELDYSTVILHLPPLTKDIPPDSTEGRKTLDKLIMNSLEIIEDQKPDLLIVTGGDTSMELLKKLGVERLQIEAELFPGIPLTSGSGANGQIYRIVLKPGSFGDENIFEKLLHLLRKVDDSNL